jgi:universal stress protein A
MNDNQGSASAKSARLSVHVKPGPAHATDPGGLGLVPSALKLQRILVPVDFSEPSQKALRYAAKFGEQFGSAVTLLHVIQPMVYPTDFGYPPAPLEVDEAVRSRIEQRLVDLGQTWGMQGQPLIRFGQPYQEIGLAAAELQTDLIIIATHGRTGLKHVLLGSTAERVLRHAPCPVLIVREREHDFV